MSCFSEWKLTVYLDGELSADELRPLETHLVSCQSCRALVVSLREEAELLSDVLQEREVRLPERAEQPAQGGEQRALAEVRQPSLGNGARHERLFAQTDQEVRGPRRQAGRAVGDSERERKLGRLCDFGFGNGRHGSVLGSRAQAGRN